MVISATAKVMTSARATTWLSDGWLGAPLGGTVFSTIACLLKVCPMRGQYEVSDGCRCDLIKDDYLSAWYTPQIVVGRLRVYGYVGYNVLSHWESRKGDHYSDVMEGLYSCVVNAMTIWAPRCDVATCVGLMSLNVPYDCV